MHHLSFSGSLTLGAKPNYYDLKNIRSSGINILISLLESNKNKQVERECKELGIENYNYPIPNTSHKYWDNEQTKNDIVIAVIKTHNLLHQGKHIYLHCHAGVHRTGSVTVGILALDGYSKKETKQILNELRPIAAQNMGEDRFNWVYDLCNLSKPTKKIKFYIK